jgi:hypothetical protein
MAFAQDDEGHFDASVNGAGVFTKEADGNGIKQTATNTVNYFGTFRLKFNAMNSLAITYGRAKDSQIYSSAFDFRVPATMIEYSVAYVFSPFQRPKWEPFALLGGAELAFRPHRTLALAGTAIVNGVAQPNWVPVSIGAAGQTQTALLYGGGVDYRLPWLDSKFAIRLQYRGFFYSAPDFKITGTEQVNFLTGAKTHTAEPSIGVVYRF